MNLMLMTILVITNTNPEKIYGIKLKLQESSLLLGQNYWVKWVLNNFLLGYILITRPEKAGKSK